LTDMQRYIAVVAITPSALRNLGAKGFVAPAQDFLAGINLKPLVIIDPSDYSHWLDCETEELMKEFPINLWGPARKSINIFMVMALLNRYLCAAFSLDRLEKALEVPLDSRVQKSLLDWAKREKRSCGELRQPISIKDLNPGNSKEFQNLATEAAERMSIPRGLLDVYLWP